MNLPKTAFEYPIQFCLRVFPGRIREVKRDFKIIDQFYSCNSMFCHRVFPRKIREVNGANRLLLKCILVIQDQLALAEGGRTG